MALSHPESVEIIRRNFVPVAVGHPALLRFASEGAIDKLPRGQTSVYVLSPQGKEIHSDVRGIGSHQQLITVVREAMAKAGRITPRTVREPQIISPNWGVGVTGEKARVGLFFRLDANNNEYRIWNIDLSRLRALAPKTAIAGAVYTLPPQVTRELLPIMGYIPPWIPDQIRRSDVTAKVVSVSEAGIQLSLEGSLSGHYQNGRPSEGRIRGLIGFSRDGRPTSLMLVSNGTYDAGWAKYKTEGLMEWRAEGQTGRRVSGGS